MRTGGLCVPLNIAGVKGYFAPLRTFRNYLRKVVSEYDIEMVSFSGGTYSL